MSVVPRVPAGGLAGAVILCTCAALPAQDRAAALRQAAGEPPSPQQPAAVPQAQSPPGQVRLIDVSLDIVGAVGGSTQPDSVLQDLQGGGHDPRKRGFTLQQAELSLGGAVDPYFNAEAHVVTFIDPIVGDSVLELEEAFLTSQALPWDLQLKGGMYLTEFGRINATHPHAWDWQDQPVIITRIFGADGLRAPGARLSWLLPTGNFTELTFGVQNANGEETQSFLANADVYGERPVGGRSFVPVQVRSFADMLYSARLSSSFDLGEASSTAIGVSTAFGPNATGNGADTWVWGADFVYKWRPLSTEQGWPYLKVQGEFLCRRFEAAAQTDASNPLNPVAVVADTLRDWGGYLQALWGCERPWDIGVRCEWATGSGASYDPATQTFSRASDMFRADRFRVSPMVQYHPSEFSRFRLQYNYDDTDALADPVHSVWLGFEVLIGTHPAHKY